MEQRRRWGADRHDEVWAGELHVNPAPHGRHAQVQLQVMTLLEPLARAAGLTALGESNLGEEADLTAAALAAQIDWPAPDED